MPALRATLWHKSLACNPWDYQSITGQLDLGCHKVTNEITMWSWVTNNFEVRSQFVIMVTALSIAPMAVTMACQCTVTLSLCVCVAMYTQKFNSNTQGSAKCTFYATYKTLLHRLDVLQIWSRGGNVTPWTVPPRKRSPQTVQVHSCNLKYHIVHQFMVTCHHIPFDVHHL